MKKMFSQTLTPSFAISILALAIALSGGAAYATSRATAAPNSSLTCVVIKPSQFLNGWHNLASSDGFRSARACRDSLGFVHLDGGVTGGAASSSMFRLPRGFRPAFNKAYSVAAGNGGPKLEDLLVIGRPSAGAGLVEANGSATDAVWLDGVIFRAGG